MEKSISNKAISVLLVALMIISLPLSKPVEAKAIASEILLFGGLVCAVASAIGVTFAIQNGSKTDLAGMIASRWNGTSTPHTPITSIMENITIERGKIKVPKAEFEEVQSVINAYGTTRDYVNVTIGGNEQNLYIRETNTIHYPSEMYKITNGRYTITGLIGADEIEFTSGSNSRGVRLYNNGVSVWSQSFNDSYKYSKTNTNIAVSDRYFGVANQNGRYTFIIVSSSTVYYVPSSNDMSSFLNITTFDTDKTLYEPIEDINPGDSVFIDVNNNQFQSLETALNTALELSYDGDIVTDTTVSETLEPETPDTDLGFITAFHSIWEYVEHFIESATKGFQLFIEIFNMLPQTIRFSIYGFFILLVFGGVISLLLL